LPNALPGKIVEMGKHSELMELEGVYSELVKIQGGDSSTSKTSSNAVKKSDKKKTLKTASETVQKVIEETDKEEVYPVSFIRLLKVNKPEAGYIVAGIIAAMMVGVINPVFAIIFSEFINLFFLPPSEIIPGTYKWIAAFCGIGVGALIGQTLQSGLLGIAGERLTRRVRELTFKGLIKMNIGWFDEEKHASGVISARLASDATKVENLVGTRLGLSIANMSTIVAGNG
jgi:ABC-type multidrug transport system fused ATPase/permease subunit